MKDILERALSFVMNEGQKPAMRWIAGIIAACALAAMLSSCGVQYVHQMTYQNGDEVVTISCETQTEAHR